MLAPAALNASLSFFSQSLGSGLRIGSVMMIEWYIFSIRPWLVSTPAWTSGPFSIPIALPTLTWSWITLIESEYFWICLVAQVAGVL